MIFFAELDDGTVAAIRNILSEEERLLKYLNTADSFEYEPVMQKYVNVSFGYSNEQLIFKC